MAIDSDLLSHWSIKYRFLLIHWVGIRNKDDSKWNRLKIMAPASNYDHSFEEFHRMMLSYTHTTINCVVLQDKCMQIPYNGWVVPVRDLSLSLCPCVISRGSFYTCVIRFGCRCYRISAHFLSSFDAVCRYHGTLIAWKPTAHIYSVTWNIDFLVQRPKRAKISHPLTGTNRHWDYNGDNATCIFRIVAVATTDRG